MSTEAGSLPTGAGIENILAREARSFGFVGGGRPREESTLAGEAARLYELY